MGISLAEGIRWCRDLGNAVQILWEDEDPAQDKPPGAPH